jgi:hypothetical protein
LDGLLGERRTIVQQGLLKLSGRLRLFQLRSQMVAEVLLVLPSGVAEGTLGSVYEIKSLLDERTSLQGGKKRRISLQFGEIFNDRGRLGLCEIRESLRCVGECP